MRYAFIREQQAQYPVRRLCQMMRVHPSGYYAWLARPESRRRRDDEVLLGHIKHAWLESGGVYGYRKVHTDLQELGVECGKHRVHRLMRHEGLRSQTGYRRRPSPRGGRPSVIAPNRLQQQFSVAEPNRAWVTDITYIRTHEGWLYLAVVLDLFSRQVVGWSMQARIDRELVLDALLMAVWRRQPRGEVIVHSDPGRRGNCHDNAVAESFFQLLKRERIRRRIYPSRDAARQDVFEYIEMFYNPVRRHGHVGKISPIEFERRHTIRLESV